MLDLTVGDRISFTYGKGAIGFGLIKKIYKKKAPIIKFDKQVPPGLLFDDLRDIQILKHKQ